MEIIIPSNYKNVSVESLPSFDEILKNLNQIVYTMNFLDNNKDNVKFGSIIQKLSSFFSKKENIKISASVLKNLNQGVSSEFETLFADLKNFINAHSTQLDPTLEQLGKSTKAQFICNHITPYYGSKQKSNPLLENAGYVIGGLGQFVLNNNHTAKITFRADYDHNPRALKDSKKLHFNVSLEFLSKKENKIYEYALLARPESLRFGSLKFQDDYLAQYIKYKYIMKMSIAYHLPMACEPIEPIVQHNQQNISSFERWVRNEDINIKLIQEEFSEWFIMHDAPTCNNDCSLIETIFTIQPLRDHLLKHQFFQKYVHNYSIHSNLYEKNKDNYDSEREDEDDTEPNRLTSTATQQTYIKNNKQKGRQGESQKSICGKRTNETNQTLTANKRQKMISKITKAKQFCLLGLRTRALIYSITHSKPACFKKELFFTKHKPSCKKLLPLRLNKEAQALSITH